MLFRTHAIVTPTLPSSAGGGYSDEEIVRAQPSPTAAIYFLSFGNDTLSDRSMLINARTHHPVAYIR
jgi:hypothetical protein